MQIVLRAVVVFVFLYLITRVVGKRELSQLSSFELVLLVVVGDLIQQGVTQQDYSVTGAVLAVGTFALLSVALSWITWKFRRSRELLDGVPTVIVRSGEIIDRIASYERIPREEILEAMREQQIRDLADVEVGVLEPDGRYSFFTRSGQGDAPDRSASPAG